MIQINNPKVVLVTGSSSGFGLLTSLRLASAGHRVFATMRNLSKRQFLDAEAKKRGVSLEIIQLDVTDKTSIQNAARQILSKEKTIDVLINNAGYGVGGFFEDLSENDIRRQMETNFFGAQNVCREVIPMMRKNSAGTIINISSIAGLYATPAFGAYNASKWALEGFSESLYYEMKLFGIRVCLIEPGTYNTTIFHGNKRLAEDFLNPQSPYYEYSQFLNKRVTEYVSGLKKDPEDIARMIEKLIAAKNPPFRNFPDLQSKIIFSLRRALPFKFYSWILMKGIFSGLHLKGHSHSLR